MKRRTPLTRGQPPKRSKRPNPRNAERKAKELLRAYGPPERREWVTRQPSVVSGKGPCVNAHVVSGGVSRKADACWIVPLTDDEHRELHRIGVRSFEAKYNIHLVSLASLTEARWQAHLASQSPRPR